MNGLKDKIIAKAKEVAKIPVPLGGAAVVSAGLVIATAVITRRKPVRINIMVV